MGFPDGSVGKESACNAGDPGSIPGLGRAAGEGIDYPLQYSWASLWLSWGRICPQCGRPGFNPWVGKIPGRREQLPTLVFWPGEFHGLYSPWGHKELDTTERLSLHFQGITVTEHLLPREDGSRCFGSLLSWRVSAPPRGGYIVHKNSRKETCQGCRDLCRFPHWMHGQR